MSLIIQYCNITVVVFSYRSHEDVMIEKGPEKWKYYKNPAVMDGQLISWSMKDPADALALSRSDFHVKNATMVTMIGRATQSTMRLMGSFTWHIAVTEGFGLSSSLFWNKKADLKSRNTALLFSVVFTRHLHLLLLSSFWSFVTRVMLQRVWLVRLYLHRGETDRETSHSCRSSPGSVHLNISAFSFGLRQ